MHASRQTSKRTDSGHKILNGVLCLLAIILCYNVMGAPAWAQHDKTQKTQKLPEAPKIEARHPKRVNRVVPQIPGANRLQKNKLFLEHADELTANAAQSAEYQVLRGNVQFRKEGVFMWCDSAYFYNGNNSLDAFGHVKMSQGDTLFVYSDVLYYSGDDDMAQLRYNVKLENRDVTLFTDSLDYDMALDYGYYFEGGKIVDSKNELSSLYGQYEPRTKHAEFLYDVELVNEKYVMHTDTLHYNTDTHIADIVGKTTIVSDSNIIYSKQGWYNTDEDKATLYKRSLVVGKNGQKLVGDTVFYDRNKGRGEAWGNVILTDSVRSSILDGDYGYHDEKSSVSFATKRARAREYSQGDTLYLHGDTLRTHLDQDSLRVLTAWPRVRFYRKDLQGVCDSMTFTECDTILRMFKKPVVWAENRQIFGGEINVHMNDSTVDWAKLPDFGFMAEQIEDIYYNQLSGKEMIAHFENSDLRRLDVNGNVMLLTFPMESDSTSNKLVNGESSYMTMLMKPKRQVERTKMWPETRMTATPLFLARKAQLYLNGFQWYETLRPTGPDDIFRYDAEGMNELMNSQALGVRRKKKK